MNQRVTRRIRLTAVAAVSTAMLLASCSGDDDSPTTSVDGSTPATEVPDTEAPDTAPPDTGASGEVGFQIGYLQPSAGLLSTFSGAQEASIGFAIDDINEAGGINGQPVGLLTAAEPLDGDVAAAITDLIDQGADYIVGPVGSTSAREALTPLATAGSVACSASATNPLLSSIDTEGVFYRTAFPDSFTVVHVADEIDAIRAAAALPEGQPFRVTVMARNDDYGVQVGNGLTSALIARGYESNVVTYNPRRVIFTEEAASIAASAPNLVVLVSYDESIRLVGDLVSAGVSPTTLIGLDATFDPRFAERAVPSDPAAVDGMRVIGSTGSRAFIDRLVAESDQLVYGAQAYDCAIIGALAAQAASSFDAAGFAPQIAGVTADGRSCSTVADCLESLAAGDDIDYEGVSGGVRFDDAGDPSEARFTTATFTKGALTEVSTTDLDLDDLRQQEALAAAIFTTRLQQVLTALGFYSGPIDGQESDELTAAIAALQADLGVPVTGVYDAETDAALRAKYGSISAVLTDSVIGIQQLLTDLGLYDGPIDGVYSQQVVESVRALQAILGVPQTGVIDAATLRAAYEQGIVTGTPPTTTVPPETTVPPTAPPTTEAPPTTPPPTETTQPPVEPPDPADPSVFELLESDPRFSTLLSLVIQAGYTGDAEVLGPITLFAPTNDAFDALDPDVLDALAADPELLQAVLAYHLVDDGLTIEMLATLTEVPSVYGLPLTITVDGSTVKVNGATVLAPELVGRNGVIIPIDTVLQPATPV